MEGLYFAFYNFVRIHKTLKVTPAMQAGIATTVLTFDDLLARVDVANPPAKVRGPYKKRTP